MNAVVCLCCRQKIYLEALVVNSHLAADAKLNLESVHADEVPRVEKSLILFRWGHKPIVRILRNSGSRRVNVCSQNGRYRKPKNSEFEHDR